MAASIAAAPLQARADEPNVLVFAAASLKNALDDVDAAYGKARPAARSTISYAASSALAKQIEQRRAGRHLHLGRLDWMDYLAAART